MRKHVKMRIVEKYSHLNGWEYLLVHKKHLWEEIESVISSIDAEQYHTKVSKEKRMMGNLLYNPGKMNLAFKERLQEKGWKESRVSYWVTRNERLVRKTLAMPQEEQKSEILAAGETPIFSYNQTDFVKERIAIEVQFGKYAFVA